MRASIYVVLALAVIGLVVGGVHRAAAQSRSRINTDRDGVAVEGYDPVAYFTLGEAVRGSREITLEHDGATYRFSSTENRERFAANPEEYLPEYGGWCAYAMADGSFARIDPEQFVVHDGRLFLNFNRRINRRFNGDLDGYITAADSNWPRVQGQLR